jgi:PP-loop superfamily ATP-utilizing enzyme
MFAGDVYGAVAIEIKAIGYTHVTLDLEGYRRGSLNSVPITFRGESKAESSNRSP